MTIPRTLIACTFLTACALVAGCNIVGPASYLISGPDKVKAQYTLPETRPTIVFVDDRGSVLPNRATRQRIAQAAERVLLDSDAGKKLVFISSEALVPIAAQERFGKPKGIADVGTEVGAEVVIYATIDSFTLSPDGQEYAPTAVFRVKVMDAKNKLRLWPDQEPGWHRVESRIPTRTIGLPTTVSARTEAEYGLADIIGRDLARLFIPYVSEEVARRVGG